MADIYNSLPRDLQQRILLAFACEPDILRAYLLANKKFSANFEDLAFWKLLAAKRIDLTSIDSSSDLQTYKKLYTRRVERHDFVQDQVTSLFLCSLLMDQEGRD